MADPFLRPKDSIPAYQERAISSLANTHGDLGENVTSLNLTKLERSLTEALSQAKVKGKDRPFFNALVARAEELEPISSVAWNEAQKRIYIDLFSLYQSMLETDGADIYSGELTREKFLQTRSAILKVINEVRLYQFLKANPEYQDAKFINFHAALNESTSKPLAVVDSDVRLLELAPRVKDVQSRANFDLRTTRVSIETLGAEANGYHKDFAPSRMLDSNPESFWADVAMSDGPIKQTYAPSGDAGLGTTIDCDGVLVHVYLTLSHAAISNNIRILPFGEFPVRVVDLAYKESSAQDTWVVVPGFEVEDETLDWIEVSFEPRTVAQLRITLEQRNYVLNTYHLPERLVRNALLWQQLSQDSADNTISQIQLSTKDESELLIHPTDISKLQILEDFKDELGNAGLPLSRERQFSLGAEQIKAAAASLAKIKPELADDVLGPVTGDKVTTTNKIVTVRKYEYLYGIRSVELANITYQPLGNYSSQKFSSTSTILDISLTTEEKHPKSDDGLGEYFRTSTEWEVEIGRDRKYAIAPRNWEVNGELVVPDEYLRFDRGTKTAVTRLPISDKATVLRRNGERVPLDHYTVTALDVTDPYTTTTVEPALRGRNSQPIATQVGRGVVSIINDRSFDANAVYTLQYVAQPGSDVLQIDGVLNSTSLIEPEVFQETNRQQAIVLSRVPYIDYSIVNSDEWSRENLLDAKWKFVPGLPNYKTGTITAAYGSPTITGSGTLFLTGLDTTKTNALRVEGDDSIYKILSVNGNGSITLAETYKGTSGSGLSYVAGEYFESDGYLYAFDQIVYEPIRVYVNDVKAYSLTDYEALEHQAFTDKPKSGRQYQFIHSGNLLYFNAPISRAKIEVYYSYLAEYVKVNATLRCNIPVATVLSPKVNSIRVELKTNKL